MGVPPPGGGSRRAGKRKRFWLLLLPLILVPAGILWRSRPPAPIRIGVLHSLTGTMAISERPLVDAVRLAVEELNAQGGLLGRPIEMVVADGRSDPAVFSREAARLIETEKVSALFGCWTSASRKAVTPIVERNDHLLFYPVQYEGLEQSRNVVYLGSLPNQQIIPGVRWAIDTFGKRVYLVGSDYVFPRMANWIIRDFARASGVEILAERYLPLGSGEPSAIVEEIRRLQPDVVLNTINGDSNRAFLRALRAAGLERMPLMSFSLAEGELTAMGAEAFLPDHYAVWGYFQSLPGDSNRRFVGAFKSRFGQDRATSDPIKSAYAAVVLWAVAVREVGRAEAGLVNRVVAQETLAGPAGVMALDSSTRHVWQRTCIGRAQADGQFEVVYAPPEALRPVPFPPVRSMKDWRKILARIESGREGGP